MDQFAFVLCPQCHHQNPVLAQSCELCEWKLHGENEQTQIINSVELVDGKTIDPNHPVNNTVDPLATVDPSILDAQKKQGLDNKTFNLAGDLAHFEVLKILGQGGMGMVYHAKDRTLHRDVALKMLRPITGSNQLSTEVLLDEARLASQLNHPNIVTIYDVARTDNSNYIVMEWVDGQPLDQLIPNDGLPLATAILYASQIAHGLSSAHQKYIIHRDIKPQNIMLSDQNILKILDFGIAGLVEHLSDDKTNNKINQTTPAAGTPSYMSPEQAQGLNLDPRSDIFSLGIVLYQMIIGVRPFTGKDAASVKLAICAGNYVPIEQLKPDVPPSVVQTINKMLATAKNERWQSTSDLAKALDDIYAELTYQKNWWQKRHWLSKAMILLPFIVALGWTAKDILFPASTQQLIEQQLAEATKVAILPFENISGDPTLQLFGDGLAVNLSTDLTSVASELGDTWIVPATEISRMKEVTPKAVADKYGVELILTGSMQHMGSTRLVVLNLLDAQSGQQLKTTEVSIRADDLFNGHALIREKVMELLDWPMTQSQKDQFNAQRPQLDGAYKYYVEGRGYLYRYDHEGNLDDAIQSFNNAIEIDPNFENAHVGLAEAYLNQYTKTKEGDWLAKMIDSISTLESLNKNNTYIHYLAAEAELIQGNYERAISLYLKSLDKNPNYKDAQIGLARAYNKAGNVELAEQTYNSALNNSPNNWNVIVNLGVFYAQIGNYTKALEQFKRLTVISPNNHIGYRNVAGIYYLKNDINNAIKYSKIAIKIKPSDRAYSNLGTMLFSIKKYQEAIDNYVKATELNKNFFIHWGNLADAYKLAKIDKYKQAYETAVEKAQQSLIIDSNDTMTSAHLAYYLANLGKREESLKIAETFSRENSGSENFVIATTYELLNKTDKAVESLSWALEKQYPFDEIVNSPLLQKTKETEGFKILEQNYQ
ncbi:MAG: protein kinase [Marinicella sp.]